MVRAVAGAVAQQDVIVLHAREKKGTVVLVKVLGLPLAVCHSLFHGFFWVVHLLNPSPCTRVQGPREGQLECLDMPCKAMTSMRQQPQARPTMTMQRHLTSDSV